jgi:hypothetical protein
MTQALYDARNASNKFIPVLFDRDDESHIPEPLMAQTYYVLDSEALFPLRFIENQFRHRCITEEVHWTVHRSDEYRLFQCQIFHCQSGTTNPPGPLHRKRLPSGRLAAVDVEGTKRSYPCLMCVYRNLPETVPWAKSRHEPHVWSGDGFANRFRVSRVVLLSFDIGLHVGRRQRTVWPSA